MNENKKSCTGGTLCKILLIVGLAAAVAAVVTMICKKLTDKKKLCEFDDEDAVDDYDECCYDSDESELADDLDDDACCISDEECCSCPADCTTCTNCDTDCNADTAVD